MKELHVGLVDLTNQDNGDGKNIDDEFFLRSHHLYHEEKTAVQVTSAEENSYGQELCYNDKKDGFSLHNVDGEKVILHFYKHFYADQMDAMIILTNRHQKAADLDKQQIQRSILVNNMGLIPVLTVETKSGKDPFLTSGDLPEIKKRQRLSRSPFVARFKNTEHTSDNKRALYYVEPLGNDPVWTRQSCPESTDLLGSSDGQQYFPLASLPEQDQSHLIEGALKYQPLYPAKIFAIPSNEAWSGDKKAIYKMLLQDFLLNLSASAPIIHADEEKMEEKTPAAASMSLQGLLDSLSAFTPTAVNEEKIIAGLEPPICLATKEINIDENIQATALLMEAEKQGHITLAACISFLIKDSLETKLFSNTMPKKYKENAREIEKEIQQLQNSKFNNQLSLWQSYAKLIEVAEDKLTVDDQQGGEFRPYLIACKLRLMKEYMRVLVPLIIETPKMSTLSALCAYLSSAITAWASWTKKYSGSDVIGSEAKEEKRMQYYTEEQMLANLDAAIRHCNDALVIEISKIITQARSFPYRYSSLTVCLLHVLARQITIDAENYPDESILQGNVVLPDYLQPGDEGNKPAIPPAYETASSSIMEYPAHAESKQAVGRPNLHLIDNKSALFVASADKRKLEEKLSIIEEKKAVDSSPQREAVNRGPTAIGQFFSHCYYTYLPLCAMCCCLPCLCCAGVSDEYCGTHCLPSGGS